MKKSISTGCVCCGNKLTLNVMQYSDKWEVIEARNLWSLTWNIIRKRLKKHYALEGNYKMTDIRLTVIWLFRRASNEERDGMGDAWSFILGWLKREENSMSNIDILWPSKRRRVKRNTMKWNGEEKHIDKCDVSKHVIGKRGDSKQYEGKMKAWEEEWRL